MIRNLKDGEKIIKLDDGREALRYTFLGEERTMILSNTCPCGKPTNFNQFWTNDHQHQLCKNCTIFTIAGSMEDKEYKITHRNDDK